MFVSINSVVVAFKAPGFKASCSMSRITIQSTDQNWNVPSNLRKTRIKDEQRGQVLNFKEIKWGTMRLDADAAYVEVVLLDLFSAFKLSLTISLMFVLLQPLYFSHALLFYILCSDFQAISTLHTPYIFTAS